MALQTPSLGVSEHDVSPDSKRNSSEPRVVHWQAKGREADKRSDVWACGYVLVEMLTGTRAFDGDDVAEVLSRVLQREREWEALRPTCRSRFARSARMPRQGSPQTDRRHRGGTFRTRSPDRPRGHRHSVGRTAAT